MSRILVISPHPDDESIGCGGTLCKHIAEGDEVMTIFLTSGERGGHGLPPHETKILREAEARKAATILGYKTMVFWRVPNGKLRATRQNVEKLKVTLREWQPSIIYVTHDKEMHPEHRAAAGIVRKAIDIKQNLQNSPTVLMYEVWTPLQKMDHIVDISLYIETKRNSILAHKSQSDILKFDEAITGLNRYRGEMHSWPGGDFAEIFIYMK